MDPVEFDRVLADVGGALDNSTSNTTEVKIPHSGYYFLHLGAGVFPTRAIHLRLWADGSQQFAINHNSVDQNGVDTKSRSGILYLTAGTDLKVTCDSGAYSDAGMQTIFIGFLLY